VATQLPFGNQVDRMSTSTQGFTAPAAVHQIPNPATPLLGRSLELTGIRDLLARADVRLISLVGAGGVGKTRLALAAQHASTDDFTNGAFWIPLAGVTDTCQLWSSVAIALGMTNPPQGAAALGVLSRRLGSQSVLLVMDNFEQLIEVAPQVAELLEACAQLKILVTSRCPLRIRSEHEYAVRPLEVPAAHASLEMLLASDAVQLFVQRARAVRADFVLNAANAKVIWQICARLDGLPLALELAASRLRLFTPEVLLDQLAAPLDVLVGGARDLNWHQQSLRATLDWSLALLKSGEQGLFAQLGVFTGGFDLEAALAIGGDDALRSLEVLVEHSLVWSYNGRFGMLEIIRERALELLAMDSDSAAIHERHARYFLALCKRAETEIYGANETIWIDRLEMNLGNLRLAMTWGLQFDPNLTLFIAFAPYPMWHLRNHGFEVINWIERGLTTDRCLLEIRVRGLEKLGDYFYTLNQFESSKQRLLEALELQRQSNEPPKRTMSILTLLSRTEDTIGQHDQAQAYLQEALEIARSHGYFESVDQLLHAQGVNYLATLNLAAARLSFEESLQNALNSKAPHRISGRYLALGMIDYLLGDVAQAKVFLESALEIAIEHRNPRRIQSIQMALVTVVAALGDFARAKTLLEDFRLTNLQISPNQSPFTLDWVLAAASIAAYQGQHLRAARLVGTLRQPVADLPGTVQALIGRFAERSRRALGVGWEQAIAKGHQLGFEAVWNAPEPESRKMVDGLSSRECEVIALVADGLSDAEIAVRLGIRTRTVSTHLTSVYNKFGVRSRTQAVREAQRRGCLETT
jgi:predicted ATPase/DNA-binding CsgD family transcriptional regulator